MTRRRAAVIGLVTICVSATLAGLTFLVLGWSLPAPDAWGVRGFTTIFAVSFGGTGALIAWHRPRNPIGWLLLGGGTASAVQLLCEEYAIYGAIGRAEALPGAAFAGWVETWIWFPLVVLETIFVLALFPDGAFLSRRWSVLGWLAVIDWAIGTVGLALIAGPLNNAPFLENPYPLLGDRFQLAVGGRETNLPFLVGLFGVQAIAFAAAVSMVLRYRRSRGLQRRQLNWFVLAAGVMAFALAIEWAFQIAAPDFKPAQLLFIVAIALVPVAIAIAILRDRLYDIDLLINRTIVYAALSAALAVIFAVFVVLLQGAFRPFTGGSQLAVAASTIVTFLLAQPLRRRIQEAVDRRFYRRRYDAARLLDAFGARLRDEVELEAVRADLLDVVGRAVEPAKASLWLKETAR